MPARVVAFLLPLLLAGWALAAAARDAGDDVTIYRCTGSDGQVVIGNVPCAEGLTQEVRSMVRPVDGESMVIPEPAPEPPAQAAVQYVVQPPARPLYECVRADGSTYESDTGIGEERWVPAWGGWPIGGYGHGGRPGRPGSSGSRGATVRAGSGLSAPPVSRISIPSDPPRPDPGPVGPRPRPPHGGAWLGGEPGRMERDPCHVLPQAETCARLRDRRDDIRRRFFNAQQRERDTLRIEERGLNARINADCGTY